MSVLHIAYDADTRRAVAAVDGPLPAWDEIRRLLLNSSPASEDLGPLTVAIPWWSFLAARSAVGFHVGRSDIELRFSDQARSLLQLALERERVFAATAAPREHTLADIGLRLRAKGFARNLTDEQLRNVSVLSKYDAAATFSVPGAGKTTEALAYFVLRAAENDHLVVVCPKSAFSVWEEQVAACIPELGNSVSRLTGGRSAIRVRLSTEPRIALITYQQLPTALEAVAHYLATNRCFMFLDESHRIKRGEAGVWARSILSVAHLPVAKLIMSGTPLPNSVGDLVPQFSFLYPEVRVDDENVVQLIRPLYVRTKKSELNIPPLQRRIVEVPLTPDLQYFYELLRSEAARQVQVLLDRSARARLRSIGNSALRLIRFVSNPALLLADDSIRSDVKELFLQIDDNPKIDYVTLRARQLASQGHKVLIWSSFVSNVELVAMRLVDLGAEFIHGGVEAGSEDDDNTRERKLKRFRSDRLCWVLVANPAACGEGISLHDVCHHAIYVDRIFNAAQFLQSEDRIHRLGLPPGQLTDVEIVVAPATIDAVVDQRLRDKVRTMARVLDDAELHIDPVVLDLDEDGFDEEDAFEVEKHISSEPQVT